MSLINACKLFKINSVVQNLLVLMVVTAALLFSASIARADDKGYKCSLITYNINFGTFYPYDTTPTSTIGTLQVTCTANTGNTNVSYNITFSPGGSGSYSSRLAYNGTKTISYNLYRNSTFVQILGTGAGGTYRFSNGYPLAGNQSRTDSFPIYGKIPVQPLAVPGFIYIDTITATLTY